jgi:hypothetical protein
VLTAEPLFEKVCKADGSKRPFTQLDKVAEAGLSLGVINQAEADLLRRAERAAFAPSTSMTSIPSTWWPTRHCLKPPPITGQLDASDARTPPLWRRFS